MILVLAPVLIGLLDVGLLKDFVSGNGLRTCDDWIWDCFGIGFGTKG